MIILLGGSGYVGSAYRQYFDQQGIEYINLSRSELDYASPDTLAPFLKANNASFLINAAGYTGKPNVDACEHHKTETIQGNAVLPGLVAEACERAGISWGQVSSGCIYTGSRPDGSGFSEEDPPNFSFRQNNCSFYSGSKALGEEVLEDIPNVYVWRMRIPFNHLDGPRNYLSKLMRYSRLLEATNSITHLDEFVTATLACWQEQVPFGVYNVTNPGHVTTRGVTERIQAHGLADHDFSFFADEAEFMQTAAITPRSNCVLDSSKLLATGISLRPVEEAIDDALTRWIPSSG